MKEQYQSIYTPHSRYYDLATTHPVWTFRLTLMGKPIYFYVRYDGHYYDCVLAETFYADEFFFPSDKTTWLSKHMRCFLLKEEVEKLYGMLYKTPDEFILDRFSEYDP